MGKGKKNEERTGNFFGLTNGFSIRSKEESSSQDETSKASKRNRSFWDNIDIESAIMAATSAPGTAGVMMTSMNMEQRRAEEKAKSDKESIEAKPSSTEDNTQSTMEDFRHPINSYEKTQEQPAIGTISSLVGAMFGISPDTKEPGKDNNRNKGKGPKVG